MLAGLALKDVMLGADPLVGVGLVVPLAPGSLDDPPQLASNAHTISKSAGVREAHQVRVRWGWPAEQSLPRLMRDLPIAMC